MKKGTVLAAVLAIVFPASALDLDLLCFNTWSGLDRGGFINSPALEEPGSRDFRRELLQRGIEEFQPDLIGLLELNPLPRALEPLLSINDYGAVSQVNRSGFRVSRFALPLNLKQGLALLAHEDLELSPGEVRRLSGAMPLEWLQFGEAGIILASTVKVGETRVHLFLTQWEESLYAEERDFTRLVAEHAADELETGELIKRIKSAEAGEAVRSAQAAAALDFINQRAGKEPAILMGTLAAAPDSAQLELLKEAGFRDTWSGGAGITRDEELNPNAGKDLFRAGVSADRVDYVLIRGEGIRSLGSRIVFNQPTYGTFPSDHYGLLVRLRID